MNRPIVEPSRAWLLWSLALPLITVLVTVAVMSIPRDTKGIDVVAGREQFASNCLSCHFTERDKPALHGPNLHDIGRAAASRKPGQSAAEYLLESIVDPNAFISPTGRPGMPGHFAEKLAPEEIRNLVGYLAGRGSIPDYAEISHLEIPDRRGLHSPPDQIRLEDMQMAEHVLREKGSCLNCHSRYNTPEFNAFAPAIFAAGVSSPESIRESLMDPHKIVPDRYRMTRVLTTDGEVLSGRLISQTEKSLQICVWDQQNQLSIREIAKAEIEHEDGQPMIRESDISLMPEGFDQSLSPEEINALINLIQQLN